MQIEKETRQRPRWASNAVLMVLLLATPGMGLPLRVPPVCRAAEPEQVVGKEVLSEVIDALVEQYGLSERDRISTGVEQVAGLWFQSDGTPQEFQQFCRKYYVPSGDAFARTVATVDSHLETLQGRIAQIRMTFDEPYQMPHYQPQPVEDLFNKAVPRVDFYGSKLAFFVALNFPYYSLEDKIRLGPHWTRQQWAAARLGDRFTTRRPEEARRGRDSAGGEDYFENLFICADHLLTQDLKVIFPEGLKLNSHNGLRDYLKQQYTGEQGLARQELIYEVVCHIVDQTIPRLVINNSDLYWQPHTNKVYRSRSGTFEEVTPGAPDTRRYQTLLDRFQAQKRQDPSHPRNPTYLDRVFNEQREIPEERMKELLLAVVDNPLAAEIGKLISRRIGRPLQPFDIWYSGFMAEGAVPADLLNQKTRTRFPTYQAFDRAIPDMLVTLGFSRERAQFLGETTEVVPIPSGGHASGTPIHRGISYMHTAFEADGMDYKAYRIGVHELGHTVHQNLALNFTDYYVLGDLPMSAFHECFADVLAYRNMDILGLQDALGPNQRYEQTLAAYWYVYEHAGHALTEMRIWHWMYEHPNTDAKELEQASLAIAREVWNRYYAPTFGVKDSPILVIYSHFISGALYLNSYALGNILFYQVHDYLNGKDFATEVERMCRIGKLTPDLWMEKAVGTPISAEPLIQGARQAVSILPK